MTGARFSADMASALEPRAFIDARLADLAEANALYGKDQRLGAPDKIARNDREISWLKDLRSIIASRTGAHAQAGKVPGFVKPDTERQVFFYEQDFYVLSNFSAFTLDWKGWRFDTSEAAYHWEKFAHMNEVGIIAGHECHQCYVIRRAPSAHSAFKIAEANKTSRRADWDDVKIDIMREILRAKANQHEYVARKLLATGDRELIEDSWRDDFWGWGSNRDGKNMLGKLWMELRAEMRALALPSTHCQTGGGK